ncbi:MAG: FIST C-terminal domain-containing protein [Myxococcales bacterium]|nr:FIST C-terminal domain-containing protein [Myxococcales bacterium]
MQLHRYTFNSSSGWSDLPSPDLDDENTLVLAFGSAQLDVVAPLAAFRAVLPKAKLLGCSTSGEIHQARVLDGTITAIVARFEHTRLRVATAAVPDAGASRPAGERLGYELAAPDLRAVIVLSEGLGVNGSALTAGLNTMLGSTVVVTGGLAGDGERFGSTWVLFEDRPITRMITAVGFYGEQIRVGYGSQGGWDIFGPERMVTRSDGNVLYELDGKPALALYKEYLGERAQGLPTTALLFPLAILREDGQRLVRTVLSVDDATQSMTFAGDVPTGARAQLMRANFDRLVLGASGAATSALVTTDEPVLSLAISCIGRRLVLKGRVEEETEATLQVLPPQTQQIGFYSYGELSPMTPGTCELHNQTMTLTTLYEARVEVR